MSRVIDVSDVRDRLSLPDDDGVNASIDSALSGALAQVSSLLDTSFGLASREDYFYLDPLVCVPVAGMVTLRLSNAFVQGSVEVSSGESLQDLRTSPRDEEALLVLPETGKVKVSDGLIGQYLRVVYEAGFGITTPIPEWLKEAMIVNTIKIMATQQISDGKPELSKLLPVLTSQSATLLDRHLRGGVVVYPLS